MKEYLGNKKEVNDKKLCECGGRYTRRNKSTHLKTKTHKKYVINLESKYN